jgi:S-adenosylmethionine:tRNA ribosyltransferase-isomerase
VLHYTRSDFDFDLPESLIAQYPTRERSAGRLLRVAPANTPPFQDLRFADLPEWIAENDLMVFNDTRVLKARFFGRKATGGRVELLIERVIGAHEALAQIRASHAPTAGSLIIPEKDETARINVIGRHARFFHLRFDGIENIVDWLDRVGQIPLPPYIRRDAEREDEARYQTVYARVPGAIAAPTAGLHFDEEMLTILRRRGIRCTFVTLHVGAGTFQPVQVEDLRKHTMHSEHVHIPQTVVDAVAETRARGGRVIAIGTTSLRALESMTNEQGELRAGEMETDLFIMPGYCFRAVDKLLTNFHLPGSTLLMLVSAFSGYDVIRAAYQHAIDARYRFFSYGDAMLLERS